LKNGVNMETVTITKLWHNPQINVTVDSEKISLSMPLDDFMEALLQEIGSVTLILTQKAFSAKMKSAKERVLSGVKEESIKVV
jgi:hypothetical protein